MGYARAVRKESGRERVLILVMGEMVESLTG